MDLKYIAKTISTNDYLKELISSEEVPNGYIVYTDFQSNGKGQHGNNWHSQISKNLLFSLYIRPKNVLVTESFIITEIITIAIKKVLDRYTHNISIKWPNDIYWKDKKLGGILIENSMRGNQIISTIIGVGININQKEFENNLPNPISLSNITKKEYNRVEILEQIREEACKMFFEDCFNEHIHQVYLANLYRAEGYHWYIETSTKQRFEAKIKTIERDGKMVLETKKKNIKEFYFKEVECCLTK